FKLAIVAGVLLVVAAIVIDPPAGLAALPVLGEAVGGEGVLAITAEGTGITAADLGWTGVYSTTLGSLGLSAMQASEGPGGGGSGAGGELATGARREIRVAEITGGEVQGAPGEPGMIVTEPGVGSTDVDVIGGDGEYIAVGGPAKAADLARLGSRLRILK